MNSGSYRIFLLLKKQIRLKVGALGSHTFLPGIYVYTGSAMNNLEKRVERHKSRSKVKHWHIDYLTTNRHFKIIKIETFPSNEHEECDKNADMLALPNAEIPVPHFGSSDCSRCPAHLVYFKTMPTLL